jgi:hypothetical protein
MSIELRFYVDQVGFALDVDYAPTDAFRVVQLTPSGSRCSIQLGKGLTDAPAGSVPTRTCSWRPASSGASEPLHTNPTSLLAPARP